MNTAAKSKRFGAVAAALVLTGGLVVGSASAADAADAYGAAPTPPLSSVKAPSSTSAGKSFTLGGKSVAGAKVVVTYGASKAKATKKLKSSTVAKNGKFSVKALKIKKKGTYYVKVVITKKGYAKKTAYYKIKIK